MADERDPAVADGAALRAFVAVARLGSVVRGAQAVGLTQPSLSARIAKLEAGWSTRLFRREGRGMTLTPEGARLLPLAEGALRGLEDLDRAAGAPIAPVRELRLGSGDALGREVLPRVLARLLRVDRDLSVRLVEGAAPRLLDALRAGEIDLALVVLPGSPSPREGIDIEPLFSSRVDLLAPPGTRLGGAKGVALEALRGRRLVTLQAGSGFRRHVERAFSARGIPFAPAVEVGSLSLVRRFVAAGLGLAPVPAVAFSTTAAGPRVERRPLLGIPDVGYHAARRAAVPLSESARSFLALVACAGAIGPGAKR